MSEERKVSVRIGGNEYVVHTQDSEEHILTIADHVERIVSDLSNDYPEFAKYQVATLAALQIADELYKTRIERNELKRSFNLPNYALSVLKSEIKVLTAEYARTQEIYAEAFEAIIGALAEADAKRGNTENFQSALRRVSNTLSRRKVAEDANQMVIEQIALTDEHEFESN